MNIDFIPENESQINYQLYITVLIVLVMKVMNGYCGVKLGLFLMPC